MSPPAHPGPGPFPLPPWQVLSISAASPTAPFPLAPSTLKSLPLPGGKDTVDTTPTFLPPPPPSHPPTHAPQPPDVRCCHRPPQNGSYGVDSELHLAKAKVPSDSISRQGMQQTHLPPRSSCPRACALSSLAGRSFSAPWLASLLVDLNHCQTSTTKTH